MSDTAKDQATAQVESICAMVSALNCDYGRLEELKQEREDLLESVRDCEKAVTSGEIHSVDIEDARRDLDGWDERYAEELADLIEAAGECESEEEARERIQEDALSLEVRSGWSSSKEEFEAEEFRIVLCTGGPHVEILGELDEHNEPDRVRIIYKDWGTSGELFDFDHDAVLTYCRQFCFGG